MRALMAGRGSGYKLAVPVVHLNGFKHIGLTQLKIYRFYQQDNDVIADRKTQSQLPFNSILIAREVIFFGRSVSYQQIECHIMQICFQTHQI
jgi:hypothetical protein